MGLYYINCNMQEVILTLFFFSYILHYAELGDILDTGISIVSSYVFGGIGTCLLA